MLLIRLEITRGDELVRQVSFKYGLNLILDKPTLTSTESGNNVGKTTVLRLIDFCFGSEGDDIWKDNEFQKNVNQEVYDYLHGTIPVVISLHLEDKAKAKHTLRRSFANGKEAILSIDDKAYRNVKDYRAALKLLLFGSGGLKPGLRQLMPKFVRSSPALMNKTLKYLGEYATETDYEALHLFLFGFFAVDVLEERPRLTAKRKKLDRDLQALNRLRKEGAIEQLLIHLRREIEEISLSRQLQGEVPEIARRANVVSAIRGKASALAGVLSRYEGEIASLQSTVSELAHEYSDIDNFAIEAIYRDAQKYIPKLQHDWEDLSHFVQSLRGRKQRFLETQVASLKAKAGDAMNELKSLQQQERAEISTLVKSPEFVKALDLRTDLQEKLKQLGSLEQNLQDIKNLKVSIEEVDKKLEETREQIEQGKALLKDRVGIFNKHFSELSKVLYGETYLLHFDETARGSLSFQLTAVGANVGAGKKASQTAAFDLAYIDFLTETGINFPRFVCHDGVENIHGNQLAALLSTAESLKGQLILATLRDKLPVMGDGMIPKNTILELDQNDKLFRL
jgi:predicted nuclease with TOPRIM domain